jgi:hypothetical protein
MFRRLLIGSAVSAAVLWGSAASACLPPPRDVITVIPRDDREGDVEYQERVRRIRAEQAAAEQASYAAWALNRENSLWDSALVTRIAVVDSAGPVETDPSLPPSLTGEFVFTVTHAERGMERAERFTLTEPRFSTNPCIPVVQYPAGGRYILFASEGSLSRSMPGFLLLPVADVRSERGLALLRAAEGDVR